MALAVVVGVAEVVLGLSQPPLQALQTPLLLLRLTLRLLLQPLCHLFLVVDVSQPPPAQIPAGLAIGRLLYLCTQSSEHGAEPSFPTAQARLQTIHCSILKVVIPTRQSTIVFNVEVSRGGTISNGT